MIQRYLSWDWKPEPSLHSLTDYFMGAFFGCYFYLQLFGSFTNLIAIWFIVRLNAVKANKHYQQHCFASILYLFIVSLRSASLRVQERAPTFRSGSPLTLQLTTVWPLTWFCVTWWCRQGGTLASCSLCPFILTLEWQYTHASLKLHWDVYVRNRSDVILTMCKLRVWL